MPTGALIAYDYAEVFVDINNRPIVVCYLGITDEDKHVVLGASKGAWKR